MTTQFAQDPRVASLIYRSFALWFLGYPEAALADADQALSTAREIGQAATLLIALNHLAVVYLLCGDYAKSSALNDEQFALADEKGAWYWKMFGMLGRGHVPALTGDTSDAIRMLTTAIKAVRSAGGATVTMPINLSFLALAYASAGNFDDACHCIGEAVPMIETTNERWFEAEVNRIAGEIALKSPEPDAAKAEAYFDRALAVARAQQAKSWELRASMSLARLWRDQGKPQQARELLAPVYGWFTEGFDTLDLKEAKALLNALA